MTTLQNLTNKQVIITRLTAVSGNKQAYMTTTGCLAEIQPLSPQKTQQVEGVMGKTFQCYIDPSIDIKEHDKLREVGTTNDNGGIDKVYKVKTGGVSRRTFGTVDFLAIIMEQVN